MTFSHGTRSLDMARFLSLSLGQRIPVTGVADLRSSIGGGRFDQATAASSIGAIVIHSDGRGLGAVAAIPGGLRNIFVAHETWVFYSRRLVETSGVRFEVSQAECGSGHI